MEIFVCVGSSCHLKNSKAVIDKLNALIEKNSVQDKVVLKGSFCMGLCGNDGVSVKVNDKVSTVTEYNVDEFFKTEVLENL
jgi:NADH:ubiquinone oxidoreductase subunit E